MPAKQSITIKFNGETRHLRYDFNAFVALEEELGIPISEIGDKVAGSVGFKDMRAIVWAGLIHEDKKLTLSDVGNMLEPSNLAEIAEKVGEALVAAFPEPGEKTKNG